MKKQEKTTGGAYPTPQMAAITYITADTYSKISESDRVNCKKICAAILDELNGQGEYAAAETFKFMVGCGICIARIKGKVKILPIIGRGYWTLAGYATFRQHLIKSRDLLPLTNAINLLDKLADYQFFETVSTKDSE